MKLYLKVKLQKQFYAVILLSLFVFCFSNVFAANSDSADQETIFSTLGNQYLKSINKIRLTQQDLQYAAIQTLRQASSSAKATEHRQGDREEENSQEENQPLFDKEKIKEVLKQKQKFLQNRKITFELLHQNALSKGYNLENSYTDCVISEILWQDLELFCGQHNASSSLLSKINQTATSFGTATLVEQLAKPTRSIYELESKQEIVKELVENEELFNKLNKIITEYSEIEKELLTFWDEQTFNNLFSSDHYFPPFPLNYFPDSLLNEILPYEKKNKLNQSRTWLEILTLFNNFLAFKNLMHEKDSFVSHIKSTIKEGKNFKDMVTAPFRNWKTGKDRNPTSSDINWYKSGSWGKARHLLKAFWQFDKITWHAGQGVLTAFTALKTLKHEKDKIQTLHFAHLKLKKAAWTINSLINIKKLVENNEVLNVNLSCFDELEYLFNETSSQSLEFDNLLNLLKSPTFTSEDDLLISTLLNRGKVLSASYLMAKNQNRLVDLLQTLGEIDYYLSLAKLYKKHQNEDITFCFPEYEQESNPHVNIKEFWSPFISQEVVVTNSIELGGDLIARNAIVSGPNAGGKSTILKSVILNLLLAQTIGIAPCKQLTFTPFSYLDTYLNITDDIAGGTSTYKAEVIRVKFLLETVKQLEEDMFSFIIMDEIFKGTNPLEAEATGYASCKYLAKTNNNIAIIASHFPKLTNLQEDTGGIFKNYKVSVNKGENNRLNYPFKLEEGKTDQTQTIAIDILKAAGFDSEIINDAYNIIGNKNTFAY